LRTESWHILQHLCFVGSALLFWWAMLHRANEALAAMCLFATSMIGGALGALMALSNSPWYSSYAAMGLTPFGLSPAEDQQFAGLIMWIPRRPVPPRRRAPVCCPLAITRGAARCHCGGITWSCSRLLSCLSR
jgi:cytochrome c oxidase assembly factor CtaG